MQGTAEVHYDQEAWDRLTYFSFRPELFFDSWATVKPTNQSMPGHTVNFTFTNELELATTPLDEKQDVTPMTFSSATKQVVLKEYGNAVRTTRFLRATSFIPLDPVVANLIGYNAGVSMDTVVSNVLHAGPNVTYVGGASRSDVSASSRLTAAIVRERVAKFRGANVPTWGGYYAVSIHPDVSVDLRTETGAAAWRDPQVYGTEQLRIWNGEIGVFEGCRFIETPRAAVFAGEGASDADVYATLFAGVQALAKAYPNREGAGPYPVVVPGPITDTLKRFIPMGWHWIGGYGLFRDESLYRVETSSSLAEA